MPAVRLGQLGQLARLERDAIRLIADGAAPVADLPSPQRGHPPRDVVRLLLAALDSPRQTTRVAALLALRTLAGEPEADIALPAIRRAAESSDVMVREEATQTLRVLDDARAIAAPAAPAAPVAFGAHDVGGARRERAMSPASAARRTDDDDDDASAAASWPARAFVSAPIHARAMSRMPLIWVAAITALVLVLAALI